MYEHTNVYFIIGNRKVVPFAIFVRMCNVFQSVPNAEKLNVCLKLVTVLFTTPVFIRLDWAWWYVYGFQECLHNMLTGKYL